MAYALTSLPGFDLFISEKINDHILAEKEAKLEKLRKPWRQEFNDCLYQIKCFKPYLLPYDEEEDIINWFDSPVRLSPTAWQIQMGGRPVASLIMSIFTKEEYHQHFLL